MASFLDWLGGIGSSAISAGINQSLASSQMKKAQQWQEKMYDKQKEFWYEQQDYNSPANQVARFKEAGLNPQFMLGNIQSGQLGSSPSAGSPTAAQAGHFADAAQTAASLMQGRNQQRLVDAESEKLRSDAHLAQIDGVTRASENLLKLAEIMARTDKDKAAALRDAVASWQMGVMTNVNAKEAAQRMEESKSRIELMNSQKAINDESLKWMPQEKKLQLAQISADIGERIARKELTLEQAKKIWFENNDLWHTAEGKRIDNELKEATFQSYVEKAAKDARSFSVAGVDVGGAAEVIGNQIDGVINDVKSLFE